MTLVEASGIPGLFRRQPALAVAIIYSVGCIALLVAAAVFVLFYKLERTGVLGDYTEAKIRTTVTGVAGPAVEERGLVVVEQTRCVNAKEIIQVEVSVGFRRTDEMARTVPYYTNALQTRAPGCNLTSTNYVLPPEVVPGIWRIEGISRALNTGELRYWSSEEFRVIPK